MFSYYDADQLAADAAAAGLTFDDGWIPEPLKAEPANDKPLIRLFRGSELYAPKPVKWLVRGVIESSVLVGAFGAPASGKSFTAVDLALCIASGKPWHDHKVSQGGVVYFAGEGVAGLRRRIAAWVQCNPDQKNAVHDNFYLAGRACHLPDDLQMVIDTLACVPNLKMIVLDTLQRTMTGDENSTRDMSAYIQSLDSIKTAYPELTIMVIHHTGHGASDRARGSSVLKASLDTEVFVSKDPDGVITVANSKMKDAEPFKPLNFRLESTALDGWLDDDNQPVTSAVLQYLADHQPSQMALKGKKHKLLTGHRKAAMTVLYALYDAQRRNLETNGYDSSTARVNWEDWRSSCRNNPEINGRYLPPSAFRERISDVLEGDGRISCERGIVLILDSD